jgi:hypothetical protein
MLDTNRQTAPASLPCPSSRHTEKISLKNNESLGVEDLAGFAIVVGAVCVAVPRDGNQRYYTPLNFTVNHDWDAGRAWPGSRVDVLNQPPYMKGQTTLD